MATYKSRTELQLKFQRLSKPKQQDFYDWIDAFVHRNDSEVKLKDNSGGNGIILDATSGNITSKAGGKFTTTYLSAFDALFNNKIEIAGGASYIKIKDLNGDEGIMLDARDGNITSKPGSKLSVSSISAFDALFNNKIEIAGRASYIKIKDLNGDEGIMLDARDGNITSKPGSKLSVSSISAFDALFNNKIEIAGRASYIKIKDLNGDEGIMLDARDGNITSKPGSKLSVSSISAFDALFNNKIEIAGGASYIKIKDLNGDEGIMLDARDGTIKVKGKVMIVPDFVFEKNYNYIKIEALNHFIQKNKHLPDIPSAQEIKENGLNITDFSMKLLQKIEELTLYVIDLQKQINELKTTK